MVRIAKGLSQQDLADLIHKTRPLVSHIEQTGNVNEKTLDVICKVLKISPEDLDQFVSEPKTNYKGKKTIVEELKEEIASLKEEIKTLRDFNQSQKELIEMLKMVQSKKK